MKLAESSFYKLHMKLPFKDCHYTVVLFTTKTRKATPLNVIDRPFHFLRVRNNVKFGLCNEIINKLVLIICSCDSQVRSTLIFLICCFFIFPFSAVSPKTLRILKTLIL